MPSPRIADTGDLFRALFETAPDAMMVVDAVGDIVLANSQAHQLFGYLPGELPGLRIENLLPESLRAAHVAHRAGYNARPSIRPMGVGYELTGVRHDGEAFPVEIALSPVGPGLVAASIRDIAKTQRARQALLRGRYDTYLAQLGKLVLESEHDEVSGVPALIAEALGADGVAVAFGMPGSDTLSIRASSGITATLVEALEGVFVRGVLLGRLAERAGAWALHNSDLGELPMLQAALTTHGFGDAAIAPLLDRSEPMGVLLALSRKPGGYDSDKLHFLQLAANMVAAAIQRSRTEERLAHAQRLDALGQLTGGIAHDFNNLLTVVSGNLQMLQMEYAEVHDARRMLHSASRAVDRCVDLTRKLLGFSRRRALKPRALRPQRAMDELEDMLVHTLGARIQVSLDCPASVPLVHADAGELETALVNLAINARDAMPEGGTLHISARECVIDAATTGAVAPGRYVAFMIEDSGTGMSPQMLNHVLEPYFTTKEEGRGSGLGLSMVYGFARQSGGHLRIESQLGRGTRVELLLPTANSKDEASKTGASAGASPRRALVLVVEDEPDVRNVAIRFIRSLGHDVLEAEDAEQALALLKANPGIQLLFSDVVLGNGQTGFELVREARLRHPALSVLLASGYERSASGADEVAHGDIELLRKPYRLEQLGQALSRALAGARPPPLSVDACPLPGHAP